MEIRYGKLETVELQRVENILVGKRLGIKKGCSPLRSVQTKGTALLVECRCLGNKMC